MIGPGSKIIHVKSHNFISEMADQFNVAGVGSLDPSTGRVVLVVGRNQLDITEETFVEVSPGAMQTQTLPDAMVMTRLVFANITMTVESAKGLVTALQMGIQQAEAGVGAAE